MAQVQKTKRHRSALKAARQAETRRARNRSVRRSIRLAVREAVSAAAGHKPESETQKLMSQASALLDKAAGRGSLHWKTAARKKSRLAAQLRKASQPAVSAKPAGAPAQ
ncbi:MAG: 30S ribosomal protein S20 [Elusimicrobiota bacterium]